MARAATASFPTQPNEYIVSDRTNRKFSRENRIFAIATVRFVVGLGVELVLEIDHVRFGVLVLVVIPILGPQLSLAVTDGDGEYSPRTRVRTAALVSPVLLLSFLGVADGTDRTIIGLLAGGVLLGYRCYEAVGGYRSSRRA